MTSPHFQDASEPHDDKDARLPMDEALSALLDGELDEGACCQLLDAHEPEARLQASWLTYRAIGEAVRSGPADWRASHADFLAGMWERGDQSETLQTDAQAPSPIAPTGPAVRPLGEPSGSSRHAANEAWFQWRWVAGVMVIIASGGMGWVLGSAGALPGSGGALLALLSPAGASGGTSAASRGAAPGTLLGSAGAVAASAPGALIRDPRLDDLLAAHRQGGMTGLATPSGFMRAATFESVRSTGP